MAWCSWLLDQGYRGEMECIIAKIFGSEAQKEAAIELFMKTHGGRAFLHGHLFGDNVHEYLAPCIYEGEGEMLGMAFFKSLIKEHGKTYFEPIGKRPAAKPGSASPTRSTPRTPGPCEGALVPYAKWVLGAEARRKPHADVAAMPAALLAEHAEFAAIAARGCSAAGDQSTVMRKHQLSLADRQCRMSELSQRLQDLVVILATSLWAGRQSTRWSSTPPTSSART